MTICLAPPSCQRWTQRFAESGEYCLEAASAPVDLVELRLGRRRAGRLMRLMGLQAVYLLFGAEL